MYLYPNLVGSIFRFVFTCRIDVFHTQFLFVKNPNSCWLYHGYIIAVEHDIPSYPS